MAIKVGEKAMTKKLLIAALFAVATSTVFAGWYDANGNYHRRGLVGDTAEGVHEIGHDAVHGAENIVDDVLHIF